MAGERGGLTVGDRIVGAADHVGPHPIDDPFAFERVALRVSGVGGAILDVERSGARLQVTVPSGRWGIAVEPHRVDARDAPRPIDEAWRARREAMRSTDGAEMRCRFEEAISFARAAEDRGAEAALERELGVAALDRKDASSAEGAFARALDLAEGERSLDPLAPMLLGDFGRLKWSRGDLRGALASWRLALAGAEGSSPESLLVASLVGNVALAENELDRIESSTAGYRRAISILERLEPETFEIARWTLNLGNALSDLGDFTGGEGCFRRVLEIARRLDPCSGMEASALNNLAWTAKARGDLAAAEKLFGQVLEMRREQDPESQAEATALANLADIARGRGDEEREEAIRRRVLELRRRGGTVSSNAWALDQLALLLIRTGRTKEAIPLVEEALQLRIRLGSEGIAVARSLRTRAELDELDGDRLAARRSLEAAAILFRALLPVSLDLASTLRRLAHLLSAEEERVDADRLLGEALRLDERLAPRSLEQAEALAERGRLRRSAGCLAEAIEDLRGASSILDDLARTLGGSDQERSRFRSRHHEIDRDLVDALVEDGEIAEAFRTLEGSRARALLELVTERDLLLSSEPPDIAAGRRRLDQEENRLRRELAEAPPTAATELVARLEGIRGRRSDLEARLRREVPAVAALRAPDPIDAAGLASLLEPREALLAWSIGVERSQLFVVRRVEEGEPPLSVVRLEIGASAVEEGVESVRRLLRPTRKLLDATSRRSHRLFEAILEPALPLLSGVDRLVLCPDGPLHRLPFGALVETRSEGGADRFLVESFGLRTILSGTLLRELRRRPSRIGPQSIVAAFGDPLVPSLSSELSTRGPESIPLPSAREELQSIERSFPSGTRLFLGADATKERLEQVGGGADILHFATHGVVDDRMPLDSSLLLAPGTEEDDRDGRLHAWEIFEQLRTSASLVVLSACETALGRESGGDGLIGLVRAFQYAGAREVLASLWPVPDEETARLMTFFYSRLACGEPPAEALRSAQIALLSDPASRDPFHWAAWSVVGG
jgi:CHAT domain-containing protein